jgi:hypothetical protein
MRKLILTIALMITSFVSNAQGIITVENRKSDVPVEQWYVIRDKDFNNTSFFYAKKDAARDELQRILSVDDQSIEFPKGKDTDGDDYWIIMYENEFTSYLYLTQDGKSEFWNITIVTK